MNPIVIEHVNVSDLPVAWRTRLPADQQAYVRVRIEQEEQESVTTSTKNQTHNPLFGIWADRTDMNDVDAYVHQIRSNRF